MSARVLVVDDIAANVRLLEAKLAAEYFEVMTASSGKEALALIEKQTPDIVLLDVMMPELDGFEVCKRIRANPRTRFLPDNIYDAIRLFKGSRFMQEVLGEDVHAKFAEIKLAQAERCPKALGTLIKASEVQYHHEVTNQFLWSQF